MPKLPDRERRFQIEVTDRADEWSADNPALLMATQSIADTPRAEASPLDSEPARFDGRPQVER